MRTEELVTMEILPTRQVNVLITTVYYVDDEELTRKNFRFTLNIGEYEKAMEYLDEAHMEIIETLWRPVWRLEK